MTTTVSQEAREAGVTQDDIGWATSAAQHLCSSQDRDAAIRLLAQAFARHRQSAERGEVVGYIIPEMLNRKSEFEANGIVLHSRPSGMATMPLYTLPTPPEAGA
ncbi:hypothetical protein [Novosphingobium sp. ES2-1]|uniref:hypothetical protein n=1 Tax=Novosphingobium sp. ES2-1 TaxID=2780074 RepID=UPI00188194AA|nr:hypothetical protein [Novosphingobium sp. ES2-1]QOV92589.1 hypothetical protein IM701_07695 [Novosphingobium sp. ES2-1]